MENDVISGIDLVVSIPLLLVIFFMAYSIKSRKIKSDPEYRYFIPGLIVKLVGGISVCLIYTYYYDGGDTVNYYKGGVALNNLAYYNFDSFLSIMAGNLSPENYTNFTWDTGYPPTYMYEDAHTFSVVRYTAPIIFLTFNSFVATTIVLATLSYTGIWRLYRMMTREYPDLSRSLAIAVLFMPSVFFWGSGLLKDTITFSAACWFTYSFYMIFIAKERRWRNALFIAISIWFLITIKPYILIALLPGALLWATFERVNKFKSSFLKYTVAPVIVILGLGATLLVMTRMGDLLGKYSPDKIVEVAQETQEDLSREEQYGTNSYKVPPIDGSITSIITAIPIAVTAAWFRPFLWEANNAVMLMAGLENAFILFIFIMIFVKVKLRLIGRIIMSEPMVLFSLIFSFVFAFSVGLSTPVFGALVRYKIPMIPFFISSLFIIRYHYETQIKKQYLYEQAMNREEETSVIPSV